MAELQPVESLNIHIEAKPQSVKEYVVSPEGQTQVVNFVENLKNELGSQEKWEKTCEQADCELEDNPFDSEKLQTILDKFLPFIGEMPPGHDPGHFYRDVVTSAILYDTDSKQAAHPSDAVAGLLAGSFHDIGTSIIPRYQDNKFGAGHAEVGASMFWQISEGTLGENTRKLVAYSIASHTHYLKPMPVNTPEGYSKSPYWDETWEKDGKLCGIAPQLARRSDRLDTNGLTLAVRQIISKFDSIQEGGQDLSGSEWVDINEDSLRQVMNPTVREPIENPPTTLEHVLRYARSNDGKNLYSEKDFMFPKFKEILNYKISQINGWIGSVNHPELSSVDREAAIENIHDTLKRVSASSPHKFEPTWQNFLSVWNELSDSDQDKWISGFNYIDGAYNNLLSYYKNQSKDSEFKPVLVKVFNKL